MKLTGMLALLVIAAAVLAGCDRDRMSERGFRLPEGNAVAGRDTFQYMQCHQCHMIEGEEFPVIEGLDPPYVELGGPVTRVKSYGELVTAIINPSHKLASGYTRRSRDVPAATLRRGGAEVRLPDLPVAIGYQRGHQHEKNPAVPTALLMPPPSTFALTQASHLLFWACTSSNSTSSFSVHV
jgi:hypothetical protein